MIEICFGKGTKHCGKREKMLVNSILSFSPQGFKRPFFQGHLKLGLYGKGSSKWL